MDMGRPLRCWGLSAALVLGAIIGSGTLLSAASAKAQPARTTRIQLVDPVTRTGLATGYRIVRTVHHSHCIRGVSDVSGSLYTCGLTNENAGPCWPSAHLRQSSQAAAICLPHPWSKGVVRVEVDRPLARHHESIDLAHPWGFTLDTGVHCVVFGGAVGSFHGKLEFYDCPRRHYKLNALSPLHRTSPPWTADTVRFDRNYAHAKPGPTTAISITYYPTDHLRATPTSLAFTGPAMDIGAAELSGLACVLLGTILLAARRWRRT
jgi:hypothetical protein